MAATYEVAWRRFDAVPRDDGALPWSQRLEGWLLPANGQARVIEIYGYKSSPFVNESIITAKGRTFSRSCLSYCHPHSFINRPGGWVKGGVSRPGTFGGPLRIPDTSAQWFHSAYRRPGGRGGRQHHVRRPQRARFQSMSLAFGNVVFWRPGASPPAGASHGHNQFVLSNWYVDRATAQPVGYTVSVCSSGQIRSCKATPLTTMRILTFQRLDPTPQNLSQLTGPGAPPGAR